MSVRRRLLNPIKERNRWLVTRLLMLAGVLAGVGLAEISLRVARISYPELWLPDDCTGWTHRPNAEGWWRREGFALVRINSDGLRDREHSKTKPGQTLRIAVLGDSFAEALQIPVDKTFWAVLERELAHSKALDGYKIEVINFGVGGYGTAQELLALRSRVWAYSPDIVLLAFYNGNDLSDNSPAFCASDQPRPFFSYQGSALKLDVSFRKRPDYRLLKSWPSKLSHEILDRSRLLQVIARAKGSLVEWLWGPQPEEINSPHAAVWELLDTLDTHIFSPLPIPPGARRGGSPKTCSG